MLISSQGWEQLPKIQGQSFWKQSLAVSTWRTAGIRPLISTTLTEPVPSLSLLNSPQFLLSWAAFAAGRKASPQPLPPVGADPRRCPVVTSSLFAVVVWLGGCCGLFPLVSEMLQRSRACKHIRNAKRAKPIRFPRRSRQPGAWPPKSHRLRGYRRSLPQALEAESPRARGSGEESACWCREHNRRGSEPRFGKIPWREMATHSSVLAWRIPWTEEPQGLWRGMCPDPSEFPMFCWSSWLEQYHPDLCLPVHRASSPHGFLSSLCLSSVLFSHSIMSDSLRPHGLQHARPSCPSPTPGVYSNSCPSSRWCHSIISSCRPLLLLPSIFPSIRVFSNESVFHIRWPNYWSFSFSISPSSEYSGLISFRMDWLDLLAVQGTLKSLLQHHS